MIDRNVPVIAGGSHLPVAPERLDELLERHGRSLSCRVAPALTKTDSMDVSHGDRFLCAADGELLVLWRSDDIAAWRRYWLDGRILSVSLGCNEDYLCAGLDNGAIVLVDMRDGMLRTAVQHDNPVCHVRLDRTVPRFAWSDAAGNVAVYDIERAQAAGIDYEGPCAKVRMDLEGQWVIVDNQREVSIFDVESGACVRAYRFAPDTGRVVDASDGPHLVAGQHNRLHVWNYASDEQQQVLHHPGTVCSFDTDAGVGKIVSICGGDTIHVHEPLCGKHDAFFDYTPQMHSIRLRNDAVYLAGNDPTVGRIELDGRRMINYFDQTIPIISANICGAGKRLTVGDSASGVTSYDLETGQRILSNSFSGAGSISSIDVRGEQIACGAFDGCVRLLGDRQREIRVGGGPVQAVALTEDSVISGDYRGSILRHGLAGGELLQSYPGHHLNVRALRVHGERLLAAGEDGKISIFDIGSGECVASVFQGIGIYPARFDDTAQFAFSGDLSGAVVRWDLERSQQDMRYSGYSSFVRGLHYGSGRIGAIGLHGEVQVWDAASGDTLFRADIDNGRRSRFIYFDDEFTRVVVTGADGMFRCFETHGATEVARGYHTAAGYHWVAFRDGETDWIWSDQQHWLDVIRTTGGAEQLLPHDDEERVAFLTERNSQTHTMQRVGLCAREHIAGLRAPQLSAGGLQAIAALPRPDPGTGRER